MATARVFQVSGLTLAEINRALAEIARALEEMQGTAPVTIENDLTVTGTADADAVTVTDRAGEVLHGFGDVGA